VQTVILGSDRFDRLPALVGRDPGDTPKAPELTTTKAMGLVAFSVLAHHGQPDRAERHRRLLAEPQPRQIVPVTDEQLIVVRGSGWRVIPAAP